MEKAYYIKKSISNKLLIVFSAAGAKPHRFHFWATGHAMNCHILYLKEEFGQNFFYQQGIRGIGDVDTTIDFIQSYCLENGITQIYTTGQSMGAYGALHYGCLLNATRVLLFSPLALAKHSPKLNPDTVVKVPDLRELIPKSDTSIHLYVGELDPVDLYNAKLLLPFENVTGVSLKNVDHGVASHFLAEKKLTNLFLSFVEDTPYLPCPNEGKALKTKQYPELLYKANMHYLNSKYEQAIETATIAVEQYFQGVKAHEILGMSALRVNRLLESARAYATANALEPRVESKYRFASCLRRLGHLETAIDMYKDVLETEPSHDKAHYDLCLAYKNKGDLLVSLQCCIRALELKPEHHAYQKRFETLSEEIKAKGF